METLKDKLIRFLIDACIMDKDDDFSPLPEFPDDVTELKIFRQFSKASSKFQRGRLLGSIAMVYTSEGHDYYTILYNFMSGKLGVEWYLGSSTYKEVIYFLKTIENVGILPRMGG